MFGQLFVKRLKVLLRNKAMLFWTLIFPFVLGGFFKLALGNVGSAFELDIIPLAIVNNQEYRDNEVLSNVIDSLSEENENQLFETQYVSEIEAEELLNEEKVDGYIIMENNEPKLVINKNGISETIIKYALDEYFQMSSVASNMINYNPEVVYNGALSMISENKQFVKDNTKEHIDFSSNYFYTLIAMACLYGSLIGLEIIKDSEANLSTKGARVCVSPVNKFKIILAGLAAGYFVELIAQAALFAYLIKILNVSFGAHLLETIILSAVGCLGGLSLGTFIGVSNKKQEGFKIGLLIGVVMLFCFFSGMMGAPQTKGIYDEKMPWLAVVNPVHFITDGLYSLFAYDTLDVYYSCLMRISAFTIIMIILTFVFIRRKSYDSL